MDGRGWKELGAQLVLRGRRRQAARAYEAALKEDPADPHTRLRYADVCVGLGERERAEQNYFVAAALYDRLGQVRRAQAARRLAAALGIHRAQQAAQPEPEPEAGTVAV
jgi:tetratricopeptide (TPR) repeat protein